jgi:hypothetical protein
VGEAFPPASVLTYRKGHRRLSGHRRPATLRDPFELCYNLNRNRDGPCPIGVLSLARLILHNAQTYISAQQSKARQDARLPRAHENQEWTGGAGAAPRPGPSQADGQRRKSSPDCQSELIPPPAAHLVLRSPFRNRQGFCAPPILEPSMTKASASRIRCSRHSASPTRRAKLPVPEARFRNPRVPLDATRLKAPASALRPRGPSVDRSSETASSAVSVSSFACTARDSRLNGTSLSIRAAQPSTHPSRTSSRP